MGTPLSPSRTPKGIQKNNVDLEHVLPVGTYLAVSNPTVTNKKKLFLTESPSQVRLFTAKEVVKRGWRRGEVDERFLIKEYEDPSSEKRRQEARRLHNA